MIITFFGPPGIGKTTLISRYSFWEHVKIKLGISNYKRVLSNVPIKYAYKFEKSDIGVKDTSESLILWDEISIDLNNRAYKNTTHELIEHLKLHRHYKEDIYIFSQSYDDMDITLRRLSTKFYLLRRCRFLPYTVKALRIHKVITIDDTTHDITDSYEFDHWLIRWLTNKYFYLPFYWNMFDSWDAPKLKDGKFIKYE